MQENSQYVFSNLENYERFTRGMVGNAIEEDQCAGAIHELASLIIAGKYSVSKKDARSYARLSFAGWLVDNKAVLSANAASVREAIVAKKLVGELELKAGEDAEKKFIAEAAKKVVEYYRDHQNKLEY